MVMHSGLELHTLSKNKLIFVNLLSDAPAMFDIETLTSTAEAAKPSSVATSIATDPAPPLKKASAKENDPIELEFQPINHEEWQQTKQQAREKWQQTKQQAQEFSLAQQASELLCVNALENTPTYIERFKEAFLAGNILVAQASMDQLLDIIEQNSTWEDVYNTLKIFMRDVFKKLFANMNAILTRIKNADTNTLENNPAIKKDINDFTLYVHYFYSLSSLRDYKPDHLVHKNTLDWLREYLSEKINAVITQGHLEDKYSNSLDWSRIQKGFALLQKYKTVFQLYPFEGAAYDVSHYFIDAYNQIQQKWSDDFESLFKHAMTALQNNDLTTVFENADKMQQMEGYLGRHLSNDNRYATLQESIRGYFHNAQQLIVADTKHLDNGFHGALYKLSLLKQYEGPFTQHTGIVYSESNYQCDIENITQCLNTIINGIKRNSDQFCTQEQFLQLNEVLSCLEKLVTLRSDFSEVYDALQDYIVKAYKQLQDELNNQSTSILETKTHSPETLKSLVQLYTTLTKIRSSIPLLLSTHQTSLLARQKEFIGTIFNKLDKIDKIIEISTPAETLYQIIGILAHVNALLNSEHPLIEAERSTEKRLIINRISTNLLEIIKSAVAEAFDDTKNDIDIYAYINVFHFLFLGYASLNSRHLFSFFSEDEYDDYRPIFFQWINKITRRVGVAISALKENQFDTNRTAELVQSIAIAFHTLVKFDTDAKKHSPRIVTKIINELKEADNHIIYQLLDCLVDQESVFQVYCDLLDWAVKREQQKLAELQECIKQGRYTGFIEVYNSLNHSRYVTAQDKDNAHALALNHIKRAISAALEYSRTPFNNINADVLPSYFLSIAELDNYRALLSTFDTTDVSNQYTLQINQLSADYQTQVANFTDNIPAGDAIAIHTYIVHVKNALNSLLTSSSLPTEIHRTLNDTILKQEDKIAGKLRYLCKHYETATPATYSDELTTLFNFLASLQNQPVYGEFYTRLTSNLQRSLLAFIEGKPENYGWDVLENIAVIWQQKQFIPAVIWNLCIEKIEEKQAAAQLSQQQELESLDLNSRQLSIGALMDRLERSSNKVYQEIATMSLKNLVKATLDEIARLAEKNFPRAVQILDAAWVDLSRYSQNSNDNDLKEQITKLHETTLKRFTDTYKILSPALDSHTETSFSAIADRNTIDTIEAFFFLDNIGHQKRYITLLKKLANFYSTLEKQSKDCLKENNFSKPFFFMAQLQQHGAAFYHIFDLISKANIPVPHDNFEQFISAIHEKIMAQFHQILQNFNALRDERFWHGLVDKEAFYTRIFTSYQQLTAYYEAVPNVFENVQQEARQALNDITTLITRQLANIFRPAMTIIQAQSSTGHEYISFNEAYENLMTFQRVWTQEGMIKSEIDGYITRLNQVVDEKITRHTHAILANKEETTQEAIIIALLKLQQMSISLAHFKDRIVGVIQQLLEQVQNGDFAQCRIDLLGNDLASWSGDDGGLSRMLLEAYPIFNEFVTAMRNKKTAAATIEYVVDEKLSKNPDNTALNADILKTRYQQFSEQYWNHVGVGLKNSLDTFTERMTQSVQSTLANGAITYPDKMVALMASIFAYWSVNDYKKRSDPQAKTAAKVDNHNVKQPLPAQVVSIFRVLGIDADLRNFKTHFKPSSKQGYLSNHLVEILTGEGKSVTLAMTAILFALMGYDVDCACYSRYLSERDFASFSHLFEIFGVKDKIFYGTFKDLSEQWFNEEHDVRDAVNSLIRQTHCVSTGKTRKNKRILLIDEVDVFFGEDFCGSSYNLSLIFEHDDVNTLIQYIWNASKDDKKILRLREVKNTDAYKNLIRKLMPGFEKVLDQAILAMIEDAKVYRRNPGSFIFDKDTQRIGYQTNSHEIEYVNRRYLTLFAYIDYYEKGQITQQALDAKIGLLIECGQFSYAEILKHYRYVFGVTGTLSTLSPQEKELVNTVLKTDKFTYMPSSYEAPRFCFDKENAVLACEADAYFESITAEIIQRRNDYDGAIEKRDIRPVMVFFESLSLLSDYLDFVKENAAQNGLNIDDFNILSEKDTGAARDNAIIRATSAGTITLSTAPYGRGTDFICYDKKVEACGGLHVLMSFLPNDAAEETQFQGRTARQGGAGSYSMVLNIEHLQKRYQLKEERLATIRRIVGEELYTTITIYRDGYLNQQYDSRRAALNEIAEKHEYSMQFVEQLTTPQMIRKISATFFSPQAATPLEDFLYTLNKFYSMLLPPTVYRTVCVIDATGSMGEVLSAVKNTVAQMFEQTQTILDEAELSETHQIQMQFVFYRNYDAPLDLLLQCSDWTKGENYETLTAFLDTIIASYGLGNEAAEVAFAYVNKLMMEMTIQQVIWIGDMQPNTREQVNESRLKYSVNTRNPLFNKPAYFEDELQKIITAKIPVHGVYVKTKQQGSDNTAYYNASRNTSGENFILDLKNPDNANQLARTIIKRILNNIGGERLLAAYDQKYPESNTGAAAAKSYAPKIESVEPATGAMISTAPVSAITPEKIEKVLNNYVASRGWSIDIFHKEEGGLLTAKRILKMIEKKAPDEDIINAYNQWKNAPDAKNREKYASACAVYGNEEKTNSLT